MAIVIGEQRPQDEEPAVVKRIGAPTGTAMIDGRREVPPIQHVPAQSLHFDMR